MRCLTGSSIGEKHNQTSIDDMQSFSGESLFAIDGSFALANSRSTTPVLGGQLRNPFSHDDLNIIEWTNAFYK
jgi:hypothetical protein